MRGSVPDVLHSSLHTTGSQTASSTSTQEREIGHSCIKGVFLDELDPNRGNMMKEVMPSCGFACEALETQMEGNYDV